VYADLGRESEDQRFVGFSLSFSLSLSLSFEALDSGKETALMVLSPQASNLGFQSNRIKEN
jgi:hypothetical protein